MRYFREWVGLVHELRELRRSEELFYDSRYRLRVDEVVRHQGFDFLKTHTLTDGPLHAHQADTELVFEKFTNGSNPTVSEVVDIIYLTFAILQLEKVANDLHDVPLRKNGIVRIIIEGELVV